MNGSGTPPGWYPDPGGHGRRYFDGVAWTAHVAPPPPPQPPPPGSYGYGQYPGWGQPPWKGARYGRPQFGPGSLADPGRRLVARLLDGLLFTPVFLVLALIAIALIAPHAGPMFPADGSRATPGFVWVYLGIIGVSVLGGLLFLAYETIMTVRDGRTFGKRWMRIRPVTVDGRPLGWESAFGRAALYWLSGVLGWIGLLDPLWCLWDPDRQCVHDKVAGTLVIND